jgi:isopentenyl-diphosphate delta-isomerase
LMPPQAVRATRGRGPGCVEGGRKLVHGPRGAGMPRDRKRVTRYVRPERMEDRVVLVDESDAEVGTLEKQRAHAEGRLHRALSVFVLNAAGEMLLQRRAPAKYHSGGLWTNACCSHPRPGEPVDAAARRRLREEMGIDCALEPAFEFTYRAPVGPGLVEHEYDHVFLARYDGEPAPAPDEVDGWRWVPLAELETELADAPERFTPWFRLVFSRPDWAERLHAFQPAAH